jgi:hypothetical protein
VTTTRTSWTAAAAAAEEEQQQLLLLLQEEDAKAVEQEVLELDERLVRPEQSLGRLGRRQWQQQQQQALGAQQRTVTRELPWVPWSRQRCGFGHARRKKAGRRGCQQLPRAADAGADADADAAAEANAARERTREKSP